VTAALQAIEREQFVEPARRAAAERRATTPELRLLQKHYYKMGEDDAARLARVDPRHHQYGCRCFSCDKDEKPCPIEGCSAVVKGTIRLAGHLELHRKKARNAASAVRAATKPVGLPFLEALLGDPARVASIDLRELRALEARLRVPGRRRVRRTGLLRQVLLSIDAHPNDPVAVQAQLPPDLARVIYRLAVVAGVSAPSVVAAMLSWGIERFAEDLRKGRAATAPHIPKGLAE
jgi:hypothetical protein